MDNRAPVQGGFYSVLDLSGIGMRLDLDAVDESLDPRQPMQQRLYRSPLIVPAHFTAKADPAILHLHRNGFRGHNSAPVEKADGASSDFVIGGFLVFGEPNLDLVGDPPDTFDAPGGFLRRQLLDITLDMPGQRYHPRFDTHTDIGGVDSGFEIQFIKNGAAQVHVCGISCLGLQHLILAFSMALKANHLIMQQCRSQLLRQIKMPVFSNQARYCGKSRRICRTALACGSNFQGTGMALTLTFLGGAGTVTGSKYLLQKDEHRILVDCGLFQGYKTLRLRNWAALPAPKDIGAVVLTHAHLDHSGYLPLLVRNGFRARAICTEATAALCAILLPDSGHLQEQDAAFANRHRFSKHHPALPLYTEEDARKALDHIAPASFDQVMELPGGARLRFVHAGHILGAASVVIEWDGKTILFSGDIGRYGDPLMPDPVTPSEADYLLIESTYGDRLHDPADPQAELAAIIGRTIHRGGTVVVPAFAVGRAQSLLYHLAQAKASGLLPALLPVFLDSPMAIDATDIFIRYARDHKLNTDQLKVLHDGVRYVQTAEESKSLTANPMAKVIISASGMATGGRVLHHLEHYAPDPRNTILFTGFQAGGTRGAAMTSGARTIKMFGRQIPVRADVHNLSMLSAHADSGELLRWAGGLRKPPRETFVIHGEAQSADTLRRELQDRLGWACTVPDQGQRLDLT